MLERFWEKVDKNGPIPEHAPELGPCWLWTASRNDRGGYGRFRFLGKLHVAHRISYELLVGPVPKGKTLDHLCGITHCVNPAHLEPVTVGDNVRRSSRTIASINAAKTHCPHGHEYTSENTWIGKDKRRRCRKCLTERQRARRDRLRQ